ncbi:MAG: hypothetical protein KBA66_13865 [Leptospiraceae bacterium]|nr:hypothetical protein [Leptospiraceae bacterium]
MRKYILDWKFLIFFLISFFVLKDIPPILYKSVDSVKVINTGFYFLSSDPFSHAMNWDNFLTPFLSYIFQMNQDPITFAKYLDRVSFVSFLLLIFITFRVAGYICAYSLLFFLTGSPLLLIFRNWIGFPDNITFLISISLVYLFQQQTYSYKTYFFLVLVLVLGMTNHFFQFSMILFLLTLIKVSRDEWNRTKILFSILIAYLISSVLFFVLTEYYPVDSNLNRLHTAKSILGDEFIRLNGNNLEFSLLSLFHGLWLVVLYILSRSKFIYSISILICIIITSMTYDTTRVFALLSMPIMIYCILDSWKSYKDIEKKVIFGLSLLSPVFMYSYPLFYKWDHKIIFLNGKILQ